MAELSYYEGQKPEWVDFDVCTELPPKVNSEVDIFHRKRFPDDKWIMNSSMPELEVIMAIMFFTSHTVHFFLKYIGFSRISSQIIVIFFFFLSNPILISLLFVINFQTQSIYFLCVNIYAEWYHPYVYPGRLFKREEKGG